VRAGFCIEMRADERPVLEAVQAYLGCGGIYHLDFGRYRGYRDRGWHRHAKFRVASVRDLHEKVVPFFADYKLFGRKRIAFELFEPLVSILYARRHLTPDGLREAKLLAAQLARHNERGTRGHDRR
jgi:LAGLIDADG endonuclease